MLRDSISWVQRHGSVLYLVLQKKVTSVAFCYCNWAIEVAILRGERGKQLFVMGLYFIVRNEGTMVKGCHEALLPLLILE